MRIHNKHERLAAIWAAMVAIMSATARADDAYTIGPVPGPGGHLYEIVLCEGPIAWPDAEGSAAARTFAGMSGHLATITSKREDRFIERLRKKILRKSRWPIAAPDGYPQFWIGGEQNPNQEEANQGWFWINGEGAIPEATDPGYSNWLAGEPNDFGTTTDVEDNEENHLTIGLRNEFGWNDESDYLTHGFVVEYEVVTDCEQSFVPMEGPNGNFYEVVFGCDWSWDGARHEAGLRLHEGRIGHLATLTSLEEDDFVEKLRQEALDSFGLDPVDGSAPQLWAGGFQKPDQEEANQGWIWVNGEGAIPESTDPGFSNWIADEPNDWGATIDVEDNEENYLTLGLFGQHGWNDGGGNLPGYVVEYESAVPEPGPLVRLERIGNPARTERRVAARQIFAEDSTGNEAQIFIYDTVTQKAHGPYESGIKVRFEFRENGGEPKMLRRFLRLPVQGLPYIVAQDNQNRLSQPLVLDLPVYFATGGGGPVPGVTLVPKDELEFTEVNTGDAVSVGPIASCALGLMSFDFAFTNGDHNIGRWSILPVSNPLDHERLTYDLQFSDGEGQDPTRLHAAFCDLQDIGELITSATQVCRPGGDCRVALSRPTTPGEIAVLAGFSFETLSGNHFLREVKVVPNAASGYVDVTWRDDDGDDPYRVTVQLVYVAESAFEPGSGILIDSPDGNPVRFLAPADGDRLIQSFHFRYKGGSRRIERIGVDFGTENYGSTVLHEHEHDVPYFARIHWVRRLP